MKERSVLSKVKNIPVFMIIAILFVFAVLFVLLPKREFSDNENRVLAKRPEFTAEGIFDGTYADSYEDYIADQFPLRDELLSVSVTVKRLLGKKIINDVIYLKDPDGSVRLIDDYKKPKNEDRFIEAVGRLNDGIESAKITVMIVPTAYEYYEDDMPALLSKTDRIRQQDSFEYLKDGIDALNLEAPEKIGFVSDIGKILDEGRDTGLNMYYRTDHHWTTYGAYRGYLALAPYLKISAMDYPESNMTTVSDCFYGTTWSRVVDHLVTPDVITIYENPKWEDVLEVTYEDTEESFRSPYNIEYLDKKDKYSMFLNNQHSLIRIENHDPDLSREDEKERRALVVVKDSYANSLIPYLLEHYETIWVFDPRYYRGSISEWVNEHPETEDVLVLYNLATMDNDRGIGAIK